MLGAAGAPALGQTQEAQWSGLGSHFTIVCESGSSTSPAVAGLLETIRSRVSRAMTAYGLALDTTTGPLVWRYFEDREQYRNYARLVDHASGAFVDAYYSTRSNHVVMFCGALPETVSTERIVVLTHEMTHQLAYNSGLQKRGVMYPLWVSEGLATFFETCALSESQRGAYAGRARRLGELGASGRLLPLYDLAALAGPEALGMSPADIYAQCWGLLAFLAQHRPDALSAYLAGSAQLPLGRRSSAALRRDFVEHFGAIDAVERQWRQFVASLATAKPTARPIESRRAGTNAAL